MESDSASLIDSCKAEKRIRELNNIVNDILNIKLSFLACHFTWVRREGNRVAHQIAALGKSNLLHGRWAVFPPS